MGDVGELALELLRMTGGGQAHEARIAVLHEPDVATAAGDEVGPHRSVLGSFVGPADLQPRRRAEVAAEPTQEVLPGETCLSVREALEDQRGVAVVPAVGDGVELIAPLQQTDRIDVAQVSGLVRTWPSASKRPIVVRPPSAAETHMPPLALRLLAKKFEQSGTMQIVFLSRWRRCRPVSREPSWDPSMRPTGGRRQAPPRRSAGL